MGFAKRAAIFAFTISMALVASPVRSHSEELPWKHVAEGIDFVEFSTSGAGMQQSVRAFRVDLTKSRLRVIPAGEEGTRKPVPRIVAALSEHIAVNASFFDDIDRPIGAVVDNRTLLSKRVVKSWGALVVDDNSASIVLGQALKLEPPPALVVQGIPRLVVGGEVVKLKPQLADRTALCAAGNSLTLVVTGALEASELAQLLRNRLGCRDALNLDGGPSTQLSVRLGSLKIDVPGQAVPNALVILPGLK